MTAEAEGAPAESIAGCVAAHAVLLADLVGLTDAQARGPSLLPEWSVGHVLTHLVRNANSVVRRLEGRQADIEAGAVRPPLSWWPTSR